jgi:hypothetical protein
VNEDERFCRYEEGRRVGKFTAEEMRRSTARASLERYTHYYERYHAHDVARKARRYNADPGEPVEVCRRGAL